MIKPNYSQDFLDLVSSQLKILFPDANQIHLLERLQLTIGRYGVGLSPKSQTTEKWSEKDAVLITYADSLLSDQEEASPLQRLTEFATQHLTQSINTIHLLPFFPYSSDDGFSVINYRHVDENSGTWQDINRLGNHFNLMFDWVLNHVSAGSQWFKHYVNGVAPYSEFFIECAPDEDVSLVTRPRTSPLLTKVETRDGTRYVWSTFSQDQIDLNWSNPDVFFEMLDVLLFYISEGSSIVRMDAVAFLWKELGTTCLHHENTHEIIRLLRNILDQIAPHVILLTETNVPHEENISYFGHGDEAHMVYQFSLPPLLLHGLLREDATHLSQWAEGLPELPDSCTYFNFTASHDGIGVRPLQGILPDSELDFLVQCVEKRSGKVSFRSLPDGTKSPYELNCTFYSALSDEGGAISSMGARRFLCSQIVALAMQGIPGIYIHSLLASPNDTHAVEESGINRRINRKKVSELDIENFTQDTQSLRHKVFLKYLQILKLRNSHLAFHPNTPQEIVNLDPKVFVLWRKTENLDNSLLCLHNFSSSEIVVNLTDHISETHCDLLEDKKETIDIEALKLGPFQCRWLAKISN